MMISISVKEFAKKHVEINKEENLQEVKKRLQASVNDKRNGENCISCGSPIWSIGSAIVGWNGCFTCITGESDSSEDYEIDSVNY